MTNRQIIQEGIFVAGSFLLSLILFSIMTHHKSVYISDIYIGSRPLEAKWYDFFLNLNFPAGILFFFPMLFIVNSARLLYQRFQPLHLLVFHLFVSSVSLCIILFIAAFIKELSGFLSSGTLYPPLSVFREELQDIENLTTWTFATYTFCLVQLLMIILILKRLIQTNSIPPPLF